MQKWVLVRAASRIRWLRRAIPTPLWLLPCAFGWADAAAASPMFTGLGDLPGSTYFSEAGGVSGDGSTAVGRSNGTAGPQAIRWTSAGGAVGLGDLPGG